MVTVWLENCNRAHRKCKRDRRPQLPTRVIRVGNNEEKPSLFISRGQSAEFVALSYCWKSSTDLKTTVDTLEQHVSGIALEELSQTVRDAILVCRKLGIEYLWVSALCIVQDDEDDVSHEASVVADIYSKATLTIAVTDSGTRTGSSFGSRSWKSIAILPLDLRLPRGNLTDSECRVCPANRLMAVRPLHDPTYQNGRTDFDTRGWALQEHLFSSRMLLCQNGQLGWRCVEDSYSEANPFNGPEAIPQLETIRPYLHASY